MKLIKKIYKYIIALVLGIALTIGFQYAYAAIVSSSDKVTFTPSNTTWNVNNVESALNSLYQDALNNYTRGYNDGKSKGATKIGTYSGSTSIDISNYYFSGITTDNFIVEVSNSHVSCRHGSDSSRGSSDFTITKSLSDKTLTITTSHDVEIHGDDNSKTVGFTLYFIGS